MTPLALLAAIGWAKVELILLCVIAFRILQSSLNEGHHIIGAVYPVYYLFNSLMCILQVLHIIWFYYICRMLYSYIVKGQVGTIHWSSFFRSLLYCCQWHSCFVLFPLQLTIFQLGGVYMLRMLMT